ncbi:MAG: DNA repair protein RecO [Firmicutes bacterium]|nr:DNA repair protein RecO [Bacillota bacterium]
MSKQKVRGIVIESSTKGENDKWLTILCKDIGKITVKSRGSRKPSSKLFGCSGLFSYCDYIIDDHLKYIQLTSGDSLKHFFVGCDDLKKLSLANYFADMTNKMLKHGQADNEFMYFLLKGLQTLDSGTNDLASVGYIFELRSLEIIGFLPCPDDSCTNCGSAETAYFTPEGVLCGACAVKNGVKIDQKALAALKNIFEEPIESVFKLKLDNEIKPVLSDCAALAMRYYMKKSYKDNDMFKDENWY